MTQHHVGKVKHLLDLQNAIWTPAHVVPCKDHKMKSSGEITNSSFTQNDVWYIASFKILDLIRWHFCKYAYSAFEHRNRSQMSWNRDNKRLGKLCKAQKQLFGAFHRWTVSLITADGMTEYKIKDSHLQAMMGWVSTQMYKTFLHRLDGSF